MRRISLALCLLALLGLFITSRDAGDYENLFFAGPKLDATAPIEKLKELDLILACETAALNLDISIISVNQDYQRILGYDMLSGSFFTQSTLDEKRSNTVLNEKLAFDVFGNFDVEGNTYKIRGEPYIVTGVVNDRREEKTAYIPAQTAANSFLAVIDTEEKTIAELKNIGISENRFHMVNLSEAAYSVRNKPWLALMGAGLIVLARLFGKTAAVLGELVKTLRGMNRKQYPGELVRSAAARKFAVLALAGMAETAAILWILLKMAEIVLHWAKYAGSLKDVVTPAFGGMIPALQNLCLYSNILLGIFIGGAILGLAGLKRDHQDL